MISIIEKSPPSHPSQIQRVELKYGIELPKRLKDYILKYGDSYIDATWFTVDGYSYGVGAIVSVEESSSDFFDFIMECGQNEWLPPDCYPLARDPFGDYYFWNSKNGRVYFLVSDDVENPYEMFDTVDMFFDYFENGHN